MRVGVGYSENPDTRTAGIQAAKAALAHHGPGGLFVPCDVVLLFSTARHDAPALNEAVRSVVGPNVPIVGGGAVGAMTNEHFGYAGDQVALAAMWLEGAECGIASEGGLTRDERDSGRRLGKRLAKMDVGADTPVMLFYDAVDRTGENLRLVAATHLLAGIEDGLGFLPGSLVGAGLQGDYILTPTKQWTGHDLAEHHAFAMTFPRNVRIDSVIIHGCRPATGYYTVTKAEGPVILEINGQPALQFVQNLLGPGIPPEEYAFFLIFGINSGDEWGEFEEESYANRLCLAIDKERNGIVMFEPDMVAGTRFQIMHRSMNLDYMGPQLEGLFSRLGGDREPVFAFYIDCAGRAAGYAGLDLEDALVVQSATAGRVPLLGIYSGVEISPVSGIPRALDWTGVFCLFSVEK